MLGQQRRFPVTVNQEFFLKHVTDNKTPFHIITGLEFRGALNIHRLEQSLNHVITRHTALRSALHYTGQDMTSKTSGAGHATPSQTVYQQIVDPANICLSTIPIGVLENVKRDDAIKEVCREAYCQPFDYTRPPLLRASLLKLSNTTHILLLVFHHLMIDGWSVSIFFRELLALYDQSVGQSDLSLPPVQFHFTDFARWQRDQLLSGAFDDALRYWQRYWPASVVEYRDLPDHLRMPQRGDRGLGLDCIALPVDTGRAIYQAARLFRVTLHSLCLSAIVLMFCRYTGKTSMSVWTNFSNRASLDMEHFIGWSSNSYALGLGLSGCCTVNDLVQHVQATIVSATINQQVPTATVIPSVASPHPHDLPIWLDGFGDVEPRELLDGVSVTRVPLPILPRWIKGLFFRVGGGPEIKVSLVYSRRQFSRTNARELLGGLFTTLVQFAKNPLTALRL